jgi:hypothetical protein
MTDPEGNPSEIIINGAPHLDEEDMSNHHLWITGPKLKGLSTYQTRDLLASALARIWDDGATTTLDVKQDICDATKLALTTYDADDNPPYLRPVIYVPN